MKNFKDRGSRWVLYALLAIILIFLANVSVYFDFTEDDPGITFRYGANLFDGKGLVYNQGERVEGYSNFGYVVLMGAAYKAISFLENARGWLIWVSKAVNIAAAVCTIILSYVISRRIFGKERYAALLTALLVSANGVFVINSVSPLETSVYTLLLVLLSYLLMKRSQMQDVPLRYDIICSAAALLLAVWRIDAPVLLAAVFAGYLAMSGFRLDKRQCLMAGSVALSYGAYMLFRCCYFGDIVNNPFHAKIVLNSNVCLNDSYTQVFFSQLGDSAWIFLAVFAAALMLDFRKYFLPFLLVMVQWLYISMVGGDWMAGFRFWAPVTPFIAFMLVHVIDRPVPGLSEGLVRAVKAVVLAAVAIWWIAGTENIYRLGAREPGKYWNKFSGRSPMALNPYWETAQWLKNNVGKDELLVVSEGGFIPFLTDLRTIDTYGLCCRELALVAENKGRLGVKVGWEAGRPSVRYILSRNPDVLVIGPDREPPQMTMPGGFSFVTTLEGKMHVYRRDSK